MLFGKSYEAATAPAPSVDRAEIEAARWFDGMVARGRTTGMFIEKHTLTPALAKVLIREHMPPRSNRPFKHYHFETMKRLIEAGRWNDGTHQGLAFDVDGLVNDGQHRIHAVAATGIAVLVPMAFGQPRLAFEVIDQNLRPRGGTDLVEISGIDVGTASTAVAVARFVIQIQLIKAGLSPRDVVRVNCTAEAVELINGDAAEFKVVGNFARGIASGLKARVSPSNIGAALYLIRQVGPSDLHFGAFCDGLRTGSNLPKDSPILTCREGLRLGRFGEEYRTTNDRRIPECAAVVLSWNRWRTGRTAQLIHTLKLAKGAPFPNALR